MENINQLVNVQVRNKKQVVFARDLYKALEIKKRFSAWWETYKNYFEDGLDFTTVPSSTVVGNGAIKPLNDYLLTLDTAKEICMMSKTKKGQKIRRYFIEVEKQFRNQQLKLPQTPEEQLILTMKVATRTVERVDNLEKDVEYLKQTSEITESMKSKLEIQRNRRVVKLCGGVESNFYKEGKAQKLYRQLFQHFKRYFGVTKYATLEKKDFEEAVKFIDNWSPDFELRQEIKQVNAQLNLIDGGLEDEEDK